MTRPTSRPRLFRAAASLIALSTALGACGEEPETPVAASELQALQADQAVFGMRMNITVGGVREALLYADTAYTYRDSVNIDVRSLRLTLYDELGVEKAFVTAQQGSIDPETQRMAARGNVVLTVPTQGRRIESETLDYDPNRDRIWSDTATVMIHQGRRSTGEAFESDLGFTSVKVYAARGRSGSEMR